MWFTPLFSICDSSLYSRTDLKKTKQVTPYKANCIIKLNDILLIKK